MTTLDQITVCSQDRRSDLGAGRFKIGPDYACIDVPELAESALPDWDVHGHSIVASCDGEVCYTGEVVGISVHDTSNQSRTTLRCKPAEPGDR